MKNYKIVVSYTPYAASAKLTFPKGKHKLTEYKVACSVTVVINNILEIVNIDKHNYGGLLMNIYKLIEIRFKSRMKECTCKAVMLMVVKLTEFLSFLFVYIRDVAYYL